MPRVQISEHLHRLILSNREKGKSLRSIASDLNISLTTVHRHVNKHRINKRDVHPYRGRPRKTTPNTDRAIVVHVKRNRFAPFAATGNIFNVSGKTVNRRCRERGIKSYRAHTNELTKSHLKSRLHFCRTNSHTNFNKWLFSDEVSFELHNCSAARRVLVRRSIDHKYQKCCILFSRAPQRTRIMMWGVISFSGPVIFKAVNGRITANRYIQMLEDYLQPFLDNIPIQEAHQLTFQQDNAPPHKAHATIQFLGSLLPLVARWPPKSPDLNPIERCWAFLKRHVREHHPRTIPALRIAIQIAWRQLITPNLCQKLYQAIPAKLRRVIAQKGYRID